MRLAPSMFVGALLLAAFAAPLSRAEEKKPLKEADVPKAAVDAVHKKFPTAKVTGWASEAEDGQLRYVAKTEYSEKDKDGKETLHKVEVDVAADGKILEEEEVVPETALPEAVTKAIAASHAKAKITRVERKIVAEKADAPIYEVLLTEDGKSFEVEYDASGKVIEESGDDKGGKKDDDDDDKKGGGMSGAGGMGG